MEPAIECVRVLAVASALVLATVIIHDEAMRPFQQVRLIAGVAALVGLPMSGGSVSFTGLMLEKRWDEHRDRRGNARPPPAT